MVGSGDNMGFDPVAFVFVIFSYRQDVFRVGYFQNNVRPLISCYPVFQYLGIALKASSAAPMGSFFDFS